MPQLVATMKTLVLSHKTIVGAWVVLNVTTSSSNGDPRLIPQDNCWSSGCKVESSGRMWEARVSVLAVRLIEMLDQTWAGTSRGWSRQLDGATPSCSANRPCRRGQSCGPWLSHYRWWSLSGGVAGSFELLYGQWCGQARAQLEAALDHPTTRRGSCKGLSHPPCTMVLSTSGGDGVVEVALAGSA